MPGSRYSSMGSPTQASASDIETTSVKYVHTISEAGRLLPSSSKWNSIELDLNMLPKSSNPFDSIPSRFSKSFEYNLVITDKKHFYRFLYILIALALVATALVLLFQFWPHKHKHHGSSKNLTLAVNHALLFFDAQKSGHFPKGSLVKFRGDSGLKDGNGKLVGGFYDSGNNIKFSFPTAYTITLLSWSVIEYHDKYADIGELDHVKDIIKWGTDYLLQLFVPPNSTSDPIIVFSQVGGGNATENDINCWQRPEDMHYTRPVSTCSSTASDLAGEIVAALSAASLVFNNDNDYSSKLINVAEKLFDLSTTVDASDRGMYPMIDGCGGDARFYYNSTSYEDELVWGSTWLFFATGNPTYLGYATHNIESAVAEEAISDKGTFYWNNKLTATSVLFARLLYFRDLGKPYEDVLVTSSNRTDSVMCSYLSQRNFNTTPGGLILLKPDRGGPLQFAATTSFLSKLYSDYLNLLRVSGRSCGIGGFSLEELHIFSKSQASDNPLKMSYVVGFGGNYPNQVHHRSASIPWDGQWRSCEEGKQWLHSEEKNPVDLLGAMVAGPDQYDNFLDERNKPWFTEPSISSNAGLVAALIAHHDPPRNSSDPKGLLFGIDQMGIFANIL
ncbi:Glycoside hydrolase family 9 [Dillenia turbinata]|uniref:cellulase n=1 Tax=Dillenia turbinata TaxID=194707 RepID=A0AAN8VQE5_9MAGN